MQIAGGADCAYAPRRSAVRLCPVRFSAGPSAYQLTSSVYYVRACDPYSRSLHWEQTISRSSSFGRIGVPPPAPNFVPLEAISRRASCPRRARATSSAAFDPSRSSHQSVRLRSTRFGAISRPPARPLRARSRRGKVAGCRPTSQPALARTVPSARAPLNGSPRASPEARAAWTPRAARAARSAPVRRDPEHDGGPRVAAAGPAGVPWPRPHFLAGHDKPDR